MGSSALSGNPPAAHHNWAVLTRRAFLHEKTMGLGTVAMAWLLQQDSALATTDFAKPPPHVDLKIRRAPTAQHVRAMTSLFHAVVIPGDGPTSHGASYSDPRSAAAFTR